MHDNLRRGIRPQLLPRRLRRATATATAFRLPRLRVADGVRRDLHALPHACLVHDDPDAEPEHHVDRDENADGAAGRRLGLIEQLLQLGPHGVVRVGGVRDRKPRPRRSDRLFPLAGRRVRPGPLQVVGGSVAAVQRLGVGRRCCGEGVGRAAGAVGGDAQRAQHRRDAVAVVADAAGLGALGPAGGEGPVRADVVRDHAHRDDIAARRDGHPVVVVVGIARAGSQRQRRLHRAAHRRRCRRSRSHRRDDRAALGVRARIGRAGDAGRARAEIVRVGRAVVRIVRRVPSIGVGVGAGAGRGRGRPLRLEQSVLRPHGHARCSAAVVRSAVTELIQVVPAEDLSGARASQIRHRLRSARRQVAVPEVDVVDALLPPDHEVVVDRDAAAERGERAAIAALRLNRHRQPRQAVGAEAPGGARVVPVGAADRPEAGDGCGAGGRDAVAGVARPGVRRREGLATDGQAELNDRNGWQESRGLWSCSLRCRCSRSCSTPRPCTGPPRS